jgi:transcription elongation factor GreA
VVTIQEEGETEETWTLVGASEANVREQKISYQSPIGSAIMGKKVGQKAEVSLPNGMTLTYKVIQIQ